jgi:hypothetical protein
LRRHRSLLLLLADIDRDCSTSYYSGNDRDLLDRLLPSLESVVSAAGLWQLPFRLEPL